jgi:hypothetical protein
MGSTPVAQAKPGLNVGKGQSVAQGNAGGCVPLAPLAHLASDADDVQMLLTGFPSSRKAIGVDEVGALFRFAMTSGSSSHCTAYAWPLDSSLSRAVSEPHLPLGGGLINAWSGTLHLYAPLAQAAVRYHVVSLCEHDAQPSVGRGPSHVPPLVAITTEGRSSSSSPACQ